MEIVADTIDDLMYSVLQELLRRPFDICSSRGTSSEIIGVLLQLSNPRARISRSESKGKAFSAMGELLWYLSKSNELNFIEYYIPNYIDETEDGKTIYGAYGPRFFNFRGKLNQIDNIINLLQRKRTTRRAVIQVFDADDIAIEHLEIPCTCNLQFLIRNEKLHMYTTMRSNDAYFGLPHDIFTFTMIQEIIARALNLELGNYYHAVSSLHLYDKKKEFALQYLGEGYQSTKNFMPPMPKGDPFPSLNCVLEIEHKIRLNELLNINQNLDPYWLDLIKLIQIFSLLKSRKFDKIEEVKNSMSNKVFNTYIEDKYFKYKR